MELPLAAADPDVAGPIVRRLLEQRQLRLARWRRGPQMLVGASGELSPARRAHDQFGAQEERLDFVDERIECGVHGVCDGFDAGRAAVKDAGDRREVLAILRVESQLVDLELVEGSNGNRKVDVPGAF